jgi:hypothetical protein
MNRYLFALGVVVKDGERALLTRNGGLERVLEPGRHTLFDPAGELSAELHNVVRAEFPSDRYTVLKTARPANCSKRSRRGRTSSRSSASRAGRRT